MYDEKIYFWFYRYYFRNIFSFLFLDMANIRNFIPFTQNYDWLNFFGAMLGSAIGGAITYLGVYITLKYQKNSDDEKKQIVYYSNIRI